LKNLKNVPVNHHFYSFTDMGPVELKTVLVQVPKLYTSTKH